MSCPSDVNTGFIELVGPILQTYLNDIEINSYPLSISFAPRTTVPGLVGNRFDESTENTVTYKGARFSLVDVQICLPLHKGYILPASQNTPSAELVLSFYRNGPVTDLSTLTGILLCFPIYNTQDSNSHGAYLVQQVNDTDKTASIQTLLYENESDISQTSIAYKTCFETINNQGVQTSHSLYVAVFPKGIYLQSQIYESLIQKITGKNSLPQYQIPPALRNAESTIKSYRFDDNGNKIPTYTSQDGILYTTSISSCSDTFKNRFEYFTLPPRLPTLKFQTDVCPYYTTQQYKCVPFNQLTDLSGNYVIPGNKTLDTILHEKDATMKSEIKQPSATVSTGETEAVIASVIAGIVVVALGIKVGSWLSKNT